MVLRKDMGHVQKSKQLHQSKFRDMTTNAQSRRGGQAAFPTSNNEDTHHEARKHIILLIPAVDCGVLQDLPFLYSRYSPKSSIDMLEN